MTLARLPTFPKSAYQPIAPRLAFVKRSPPDARGWGPGWPDCQPGKLVKTEGVVRPSDGQPFNRPVRVETVELFAYLMQATMDLGYEFRRNDEPDGGVSTYNCRAIKGSDPPSASWHSWGLAIDINSAGNPQFTFRSTQPPWMVDLWESSGFYWGGRFKSGFEDAMHLEYSFRPESVATDLANAKAARARIAAILKPEGSVTKEQVKALQMTLNGLGVSPPLVVDGVFGAKTEAALAQAAANYAGVVANSDLLQTAVASANTRFEAARTKAKEITEL